MLGIQSSMARLHEHPVFTVAVALCDVAIGVLEDDRQGLLEAVLSCWGKLLLFAIAEDTRGYTSRKGIQAFSVLLRAV
jgi:hypothetical protein